MARARRACRPWRLMPARLPLVPGYDVAGTISALGPAVSTFRVGDRAEGQHRAGDFRGGHRLALKGEKSGEPAQWKKLEICAVEGEQRLAQCSPGFQVSRAERRGGIKQAEIELARHLAVLKAVVEQIDVGIVGGGDPRRLPPVARHGDNRAGQPHRQQQRLVAAALGVGVNPPAG